MDLKTLGNWAKENRVRLYVEHAHKQFQVQVKWGSPVRSYSAFHENLLDAIKDVITYVDGKNREK